MSGRLPAVLLRSSSLAQIRHVIPAPPGTADATVAHVYQQMEREFGVLAPPVALHSASHVRKAARRLHRKRVAIHHDRVVNTIETVISGCRLGMLRQ